MINLVENIKNVAKVKILHFIKSISINSVNTVSRWDMYQEKAPECLTKYKKIK